MTFVSRDDDKRARRTPGGPRRPDRRHRPRLGHDPYRERSVVRPRIGVMLQEGGFPSDPTVAETVRMWAGRTNGARPAGEALGATGIDCAADAPALDLPAGAQSALGRVVREATTHVLRHGDARRCAITLRAREGEAVLAVENDGAAVRDEAGTPGRTGSGLAGLRERLGAVGGALEAWFADPQSFRVTARVPSAAPRPAQLPAPDVAPPAARQKEETVA